MDKWIVKRSATESQSSSSSSPSTSAVEPSSSNHQGSASAASSSPSQTANDSYSSSSMGEASPNGDSIASSAATSSLSLKRLRQAPSSAGSSSATNKKRKSGVSIEQERRRLGDAVHARITFTKWAIEARTHAKVDLDLSTFTNLIVPNATSVTPADFDKDSPVVVAKVEGSDAAGEIFGKTKIKGGSRMGSWSADRVDIIFYPSEGEADVWWTMR